MPLVDLRIHSDKHLDRRFLVGYRVYRDRNAPEHYYVHISQGRTIVPQQFGPMNREDAYRLAQTGNVQ